MTILPIKVDSSAEVRPVSCIILRPIDAPVLGPGPGRPLQLRSAPNQMKEKPVLLSPESELFYSDCHIAVAMDPSTGKMTEPPQLPPPQAASAALISAVLGNDDLLGEILLRLDFPTCLVRAAAVSKRWLRHASDPAFLRRFRRLHPPRLLGFYLNSSEFGLRFIPLPQPPEMAAVIRRGKFDLGRGAGPVSGCRNGRLIVYLAPDGHRGGQKTMCRPLHPERASALPPPHIPARAHDNPIITHYYAPKFLFHDDGGDDVAISAVALMRNEWHAMVQLQDFQSGVWSEYQNSDMDMIQLPGRWNIYQRSALLANGKIYMICTTQCILGLDVQSMVLFSIKLPNGVEYEYDANIALSRAEGSGFYLIHVRKFQMSVWRYTMDYSSTGNWELISTISLRQVLGPNGDPTWWSQGADVHVDAIGDNADFVFFRIQNKVFYFHISSRTVEKVYELAQDESLYGVSPFMMVWPPTFPTFNGGHDKDE